MCLFVLRIVMFSGSYADSICLVALLSYRIASTFLEGKQLLSQLSDKFSKKEELDNVRFQQLADEVVKVRNSAEGIKAAFNLTKK